MPAPLALDQENCPVAPCVPCRAWAMVAHVSSPPVEVASCLSVSDAGSVAASEAETTLSSVHNPNTTIAPPTVVVIELSVFVPEALRTELVWSMGEAEVRQPLNQAQHDAPELTVVAIIVCPVWFVVHLDHHIEPFKSVLAPPPRDTTFVHAPPL